MILMENDAVKNTSPAAQAGILDEKKFGKYFLLVVFIVSLAAFVNIIKIFLIEILVAAVFATLFYPAFKLLLKLFGGRRGLAAFTGCVLILIGLMIPLFIISNIVVDQAVELYRTAGPKLTEVIRQGDERIIGSLKDTPLEKWVSGRKIDWTTIINGTTRMLGVTVASVINKTSRVTLLVIVNLFIILFSLFYFLRDGERILWRIRHIFPLSDTHKDRLVERFTAISKATVKGTLMIALIQSFLGTMTLWFFGIDAWLLWGVVMMVFAIIPFVGTGAVLIPAGIIQIIMGSQAKGIGIILISILFISTIDNFLRPRIVGSHAGMHDLLVFFSTLGGISVFGPAGFIIGPLVTALFLTVLDIYSVEFQKHIEYTNNPSLPPKTTDDNP
ncbi:MAG: hypothetical protein A2314_00580 [Elusimicrobia bacterium RIFOXYB2_FULL_50_12]|nr:MAG: hypothetical protein A2314_00580 [Elusimicrobia bacterium RIFOXYB2_FULL_50_12]